MDSIDDQMVDLNKQKKKIWKTVIVAWKKSKNFPMKLLV